MAAKSADQVYGAESRAGGTVMPFDVDKLNVVSDKEHPLYDDRVEMSINEEVVTSIMEFGVRIPIKVWKNPDSGEVIVLDGKQRVANTKEANKRLKKDNRPLRQIPGVVFKGSMKAALAEMIILNEGRQEPSVANRVRSVERLLEAGYTEPEVTTIMHLKLGTLRNYRAIVDCAPVVRRAFEAEKILPTEVYRLSKLEPAEQKEKLAVMLKAGEGVVGKRRQAKKRRAATGEKRRRSPKEIGEMIERIGKAFGEAASTTIALLQWVLGEDEPNMELPVAKKKKKKAKPEAVEVSATETSVPEEEALEPEGDEGDEPEGEEEEAEATPAPEAAAS